VQSETINHTVWKTAGDAWKYRTRIQNVMKSKS